MNKRRFDRILGLTAMLTIVLAWFVGSARMSATLEPILGRVFPGASRFERISESTFAAYGSGLSEQLVGYVTVGEANGYGGPMKVAVGVDLEGKVVGLDVVEHRETPSYFERVMESGYLDSQVGKSYLDRFDVGDSVDIVSGATYTSRAIADSVLNGNRRIAKNQLGLPVPQAPVAGLKFGVPEITLIGLYVAGFVGHQREFKHTKQVRWISMLVGLIVLGFVYTRPLTLSDVSKLLIGFWPQWQTNLYWYFLLDGILFVFTVDNKNPYCEWFCPFGAAQECMGAIGGAKSRSPGRYRQVLLWMPRGLAWLAVVVALLFRNPGLTSYEIFGAFFDLQGTPTQFAVLGIVLIVSLFVRRPWCHYLCPLRPVMDFYRGLRKWIDESWLTIKKKQTGS